MELDLNRLFWLHDGHRRGALYAKPRPWIRDPFAVQRGEERLPAPLVCDQFLGRTPYDLIGAGSVALYLLSDRVIDALEREQFIGWRAHPAEVHAKGGQLIPG